MKTSKKSVKNWNNSVYKRTRYIAQNDTYEERIEDGINPLLEAKRNPDILSDEQTSWEEKDYDAEYEAQLRLEKEMRSAKLTKHQKKVLRTMVKYENDKKKVADSLGVSVRAVNICLQTIRNKVAKKNLSQK